MLFSVVIPIYKTEKYLKKCVESVRRQTFSDLEILLVDDGSPDGCPALCDEYAKSDARIKAVHKPNGGLSDARNAGLKAATGEYVLFLDSDDYIAPTACEELLPYAKSGAEILIGDGESEGGVCGIAHSGRTTKDMKSGADALKEMYANGKAPMAAWLYVYKRKFLLDNGLFFKYGILHEDEQFTPRAFLAASSAIYTGVNFYRYVLRENSITTSKDLRKNAENLFETLDELESVYRELRDGVLKRYLLDSLTMKYLHIFSRAKLISHGKTYVRKKFALRNAKSFKNRLKALLFAISPQLYCKLNAK